MSRDGRRIRPRAPPIGSGGPVLEARKREGRAAWPAPRRELLAGDACYQTPPVLQPPAPAVSQVRVLMPVEALTIRKLFPDFD
jgi:hypothetical protein